MSRLVLLSISLVFLFTSFCAYGASGGAFGLNFQDADKVRRIDREDAIGFRVEFVANQPSPSVVTWPADTSEALPGPISALQLYIMTPGSKVEADGIVEGCIRSLTILQARPDKYKGWMWLAIPDADRTSYDESTGVFKAWLDPGYVVACELSRLSS